MPEHTIELRLCLNDDDAYQVVAGPLGALLRNILEAIPAYLTEVAYVLDGEDQVTTETMTTIRAWANGQVVRRYPDA